MIKTNKKMSLFTLSAVAAGILLSGNAAAVVQLSENTGVVPSFKLTEGYNSNVNDAPSDQERSSWVSTVAPGLMIIGRDRLNRYSVSYDLEHAMYHSGGIDDKTNHTFAANSHMEFNSRNRLDVNAGYKKREDVINDTNRANFEAGDKYHTYGVDGVYGFGAEEATMQLELGVGREWVKYDNNRDIDTNGFGSLNREKDHDKTSLSGTAYLRVAPKTRALFEVGFDDFKYDNQQSTGQSLDSKNMRYLTGLTWDATAQISGTAKVGYHEKKFDDGRKENKDGMLWDLDVTWEPVSYSRLKVGTGTSYGEGGSTEDIIDTTNYRANWLHDWSPRVTSDVGYRLTEKDYEGGIYKNRKDDLDVYSASVNYKMRSWLDLGTGYRYRDNDSNTASSSYKGNEVFVSANILLD